LTGVVATGIGVLASLSVTGNTVTGNLNTGGLVSATGNVIGGNVSTVGNVTGNYILGNGALLSGIITSVSNINNGTSNVSIDTANANVTVSVGGTSNVAVFATTGEYVTGVVSASGNITGGNLLTGGLISATSTITSAANITGSNILTGGLISATGNVTAGNLSVTGNVLGNLLPISNITYDLGSPTQMWRTLYVSGNTIVLGESNLSVSNGNLSVGGNPVVTVSPTGTSNTTGNMNVIGNITGSNVTTTGLISATGNIAGNYFVGNGSQLTGIGGSGNLWVVGRLGTYYVPIVSNILTVVGRTGNISIAINS
jgi:hypothetical protein